MGKKAKRVIGKPVIDKLVIRFQLTSGGEVVRAENITCYSIPKDFEKFVYESFEYFKEKLK